MAGDTKERILDAALELFARCGYLGTSMSDIAKQLGITKAALYKHYASKQEILDALIQATMAQYEAHSIFARADWDDPEFTKDKLGMTPDAAVGMMLAHVRCILHDAQISKVRRMLTIEQFQNPKLKALQTKQSYTDVLSYFTGLVRFLIRQRRLTGGDAEAMAAQLCFPVSVWINLCDREPEREAEAMALIERHIRQYFALYGARGQNEDGGGHADE